MSVVLFRCAGCGAEPRLDATLVTLVIDLTDDRASVPYLCPLCGWAGETRDLRAEVQAELLDAGATLAVRE
jgi:predicted RNA-binding Zn-ribbon protein involved in translation (DUF1610 family)